MNMIAVSKMTERDSIIGKLHRDSGGLLGQWRSTGDWTSHSDGESMLNWQENLIGRQKQSPSRNIRFRYLPQV